MFDVAESGAQQVLHLVRGRLVEATNLLYLERPALDLLRLVRVIRERHPLHPLFEDRGSIRLEWTLVLILPILLQAGVRVRRQLLRRLEDAAEVGVVPEVR